MSYWDWAVEAHGREGVDAMLIDLQDLHGQCVAYLLWAAWAAAEARNLPRVVLAQAAQLAQHWEAEATGPIRRARRGLKAAAPPIDDASREALREQVRKAEFAAERLLMETLEQLAPEPEGARREIGPALAMAVEAWGRPAPPETLADLSSRLA